MSREETKKKSLVDEESSVAIDFGELFHYYLSKIWVLIPAFVIGAVVACLISIFLITPKYQATSKLYMLSSSEDSVVDLASLNIGTSLVKDYEQLIRIRPIAEEIIEEKHLKYTYKEFERLFSVSNETDTRVLGITVESESPQEAMEIANALADKAVSYLPNLTDTLKPNVVENAIVPQTKSSPSISRNTVLGAMLALILVLIILTIRYLADDTVKSPEDVEKMIGAMPLATIIEGKLDGSDKGPVYYGGSKRKS